MKKHKKKILINLKKVIDDKNNKKRMLEVFIILLIFWISSLVTIRTTAIYNLRSSETNTLEYKYLANYSKIQGNENESEKYLTIAQFWINRAEGYKNHANRRTSGLVLCGYSMIFYFISMMFFLFYDSNNKKIKIGSKYRNLWLILFITSIIFLIISVPISGSNVDTSIIESINIFKFFGLLFY